MLGCFTEFRGTALIEESRFARDAINDRLRAAFEGVGIITAPVLAYSFNGPTLSPTKTYRIAAWGTAFGSWNAFDTNTNATAFDTSTGGFFTGFDGSMNDKIRLGFMTGYSNSSFHANRRSSAGSSDNYHLGLYGGTKWDALSLRSGITYSWHEISMSRTIAFPGFVDNLSGQYDANTFQMFGELGYRIDARIASFEPFANLAYIKLKSDRFGEDGGAAALAGQAGKTETTLSTLGLRASRNVTLGTISASARSMLGWRHAYGDITPTSTLAFYGGENFVIAGVPIAKDSGFLELGIDVNVTAATSLGAAYKSQFGSDIQQNGFDAKFTMRF